MACMIFSIDLSLSFIFVCYHRRAHDESTDRWGVGEWVDEAEQKSDMEEDERKDEEEKYYRAW